MCGSMCAAMCTCAYACACTLHLQSSFLEQVETLAAPHPPRQVAQVVLHLALAVALLGMMQLGAGAGSGAV